ncbi:MAG: DUF2815 family protein [Armatimonadetes bacterium]|nr:DUF2815 family protein [Armatimonadota bacterium]MCA1995698.1 DUF2815 family protein [Armatimonadota bacterium]
MAEKRKPKQFIVSPVGRLGYSHIFKPDPHPEFGGDYKVKLILTDDEFAPLRARLDAKMDEVRALVAADPKLSKNKKYEINDYTHPVIDRDTDEEIPGQVELRFKRKGTYKDKKTGEIKPMSPPKVVDGLKNAIPKTVPIYGGSRVRVVFEAVPYVTPKSAGIALYMDTIQVAELAAGGSAGLAALDEIEDGFIVSGGAQADTDVDEAGDDDNVDF